MIVGGRLLVAGVPEVPELESPVSPEVPEVSPVSPEAPEVSPVSPEVVPEPSPVPSVPFVLESSGCPGSHFTCAVTVAPSWKTSRVSDGSGFGCVPVLYSKVVIRQFVQPGLGVRLTGVLDRIGEGALALHHADLVPAALVPERAECDVALLEDGDIAWCARIAAGLDVSAATSAAVGVTTGSAGLSLVLAGGVLSPRRPDPRRPGPVLTRGVLARGVLTRGVLARGVRPESDLPLSGEDEEDEEGAPWFSAAAGSTGGLPPPQPARSSAISSPVSGARGEDGS